MKDVDMDSPHARRIIQELKAVGVTRHGLAKPESRELPGVIHDDEHIGGVIYGQIGSAISAMLIATDHRVIFLNKQPFSNTTDELTYDVVSGVKSSTAGPFTSVVLHTRISDYTFRYVNSNCARIFIKYIENKRLEKYNYNQTNGQPDAEASKPVFQNITDEKAIKFLQEHTVAVLSTVDRTGRVHGAVIFYLVDKDNSMYILTKSDTDKGRNVYAHNQVAVTIHEPGTLQTLQIQGLAVVETDQLVKDSVFTSMTKPRIYQGKTHLPPVTKLQEGSYMVIKISASLMSYHDYAND